jgi:hypothetical protein
MTCSRQTARKLSVEQQCFVCCCWCVLGVALPSDRVYDGIDLTDLLTGKTETAHTWLFHPNSGASGTH